MKLLPSDFRIARNLIWLLSVSDMPRWMHLYAKKILESRRFPFKEDKMQEDDLKCCGNCEWNCLYEGEDVGRVCPKWQWDGKKKEDREEQS